MNIPELFDQLKPYIIRATSIGVCTSRPSAFTVGNNSWTNVPFTDDVSDPYGMHDTSSNQDRLVAVDAGVYNVSACITWTGNSTGLRGIQLITSMDGEIYGRILIPAGTALDINMSTSFPIKLSTGQYVVCRVFQTSGGNLDIVDASTLHARFAMYKVA